MFSIYRSQKNIQNKQVDYKALYLQEKKLKQQSQRKAQIAQLKYRKLAQSINKKCVRCMNIGDRKTKQDRIMQLKQFQNGFNLLHLGTITDIPKNQKLGKLKIIQNFAVFGIPQSMLIQPEHLDDIIEGELLYANNIPTVAQQHAAKLSFPSGIIPKYFSGIQAKQKAIQIISSSTSYAKSFIMSFQSTKVDEQQRQCQIKKLMNPQNRLYAICLKIQDFSLVPYWKNDLVESEKVMQQNKYDQTSTKVLSCEQTDISYNGQKDCSIATSPRVYCIFSQYPFFQFYQKMLIAIANSVKTQRLVIYRQSACTLAEADSHFFLQRVKQTYRQIQNQIQSWQIKLTRQYQLKLMSCQKIPLCLNPQICMMNFVQDWGLPIFNMFNVDTFIDVFTLIMLEQKVIFVTDNPTILTFTVHLFTQLLPRPFKYPYPIVNLLPENEGFFQTFCPFVYGYLNTKKNIVANKIIQRFANIFIFLQKQGIQILSSQLTKNTLKKRPKILRERLSSKFKSTNEKNRRISNLKFAQQQINFQKDKLGICTQIIKQTNLYLNQNIMKSLPTNQQVQQIIAQMLKNLKQGQDVHQLAFQKINKNYQKKTKDQFLKALMETQIVNTYLFK